MQQPNGQTFLIPRTEGPGHLSDERLAGSFLAGFRSVETRKAYAHDLRVWLEFLRCYGLDVLEVRRPVVETYMRELEGQGLANNTRSRRLSTIKSFYNFLWEEDLIQGNPAGRVKAPSRDKPIMPAMNKVEAHRFVKAAEEDSDPYCTAALHLMLFCGLRVSEVCSRDVKDLQVINWVSVLNVRGKGDKVRRAELPPQAMAAVQTALDGRTSGPLILNQRGSRVNITNIRGQVERVTKRADIDKHLSPHCLRRTFIQLALDSGRPLRDVQRAAGHSSAETTVGYDNREVELGRSPAYAVQMAVA